MTRAGFLLMVLIRARNERRSSSRARTRCVRLQVKLDELGLGPEAMVQDRGKFAVAAVSAAVVRVVSKQFNECRSRTTRRTHTLPARSLEAFKNSSHAPLSGLSRPLIGLGPMPGNWLP